MLADYMDEISDPKYRAETEQYISQLERVSLLVLVHAWREVMTARRREGTPFWLSPSITICTACICTICTICIACLSACLPAYLPV